MNLRRSIANGLSQLACYLFLAAPLTAQVTLVENGENNVTTYRMTISPAPEPEPALKYRLLMHEDQRKAGNAAPFYYRAQLNLAPILKNIRETYGDDYDYWREVPLAELPKKQAREALAHFHNGPMEALREATSRKYCDWGWELQNVEGPKVYAFLLPEIQEARSLSRMLALQTRLAVAEGRLDEAFEFMQMNFQLGRDVASEPFLVCGLVGIAISGISNSHVLDIMAAPDSPNLYWALAELPRPLVDLRPAMRFELGSGPRIFPLLEEADSVDRSPRQWARLIGDAWMHLLGNLGTREVTREIFPEALRGPEWKSARSQIIGSALGLWGYTKAKRELILDGMPAAEVESMPVGQVIALQTARAYRHTADQIEKLWYLPFSEMKQREEAIETKLKREGYMGANITSKEIIPIASLLLPATGAARHAQERLSRDLAAMQAIEALRMHTAATGKLPAALEEVAIVPVPRNPATGNPFEYRLEAETAILELPKSDGFHVGKRFEIILRQ